MLATWAFLIGLVAMGDTNTDPETFSMIVPDGPISAPLGASITLPCSVSPAFSVVPLKTTWYRPDKFNTPVLLYENGKVQKDPSDAQYRGRVSLVGQLDQGNVSMRLDKLTLADRGEYLCYVQSKVWYEEATLSLVVEVVGSIPVLSASTVDEKQVNVTCMSEGWSPQPTLTWTGGGGESITLYHTVYSTGEQGLVRVSSWLLHSPSESEWLSCSVGLSDQDRRKGRVLVQTVPLMYSLMVPDGPISAPLGASITLPCSVCPAFSVVPFRICWHRLNQSNRPLLFYQNNQMQEEPADAQYKGRVSLVGQLDKGNVSMRLENLTLADRGVYVCLVRSQLSYEEANVTVNVKVVGTLPVLSVITGEGEQVNITCTSEGWSPQPTLTWTGRGGEKIIAQKTDYTTGEQGLVRVSSWLLHSPSESEWLSCSVGLCDQDRREGRVVPYVCTTHKGSTGAVVVGVISALVVLILVVIVVFLYRKGPIKKMKRKKTQKEGNTTRCDHTTHASASELEGLISGQTDDLKKKEEELTTLQQEKEGNTTRCDYTTHASASEMEGLISGQTDGLKKEEEELTTLQQEKEELLENLKKEREKNTDLQVELDETIAALRKDKKGVQGNLKETRGWQKDKKELQAELHETKSRLEKEKRDLQDKLDETITGWQKDKEVLTDDLNKKEDEASNLQQEKKDLQDKLDETIAAWQKDKEGLTDYLKKMEDQFSVLQQEKKDLQDKLDETIAAWQKDKEGQKLKDDEKAMIEQVSVTVQDVDFNADKWLTFKEGEMSQLLEKIWSEQRRIMKEDSRYLKEIMKKDAEHHKKELLDKLNEMETFITKTRTTIKQDLEYLGSGKTKQKNVEESK